jgi:hypothetical protein
MIKESCNCIICAQEFNESELQSVALSKINITKFKICQACLDKSDPDADYREAREIVYSYLSLISAKQSFSEVKGILKSLDKESKKDQ